MEKVTVQLDVKWVKRINSPLFRIVAALTGVSVSFALAFLYLSGKGWFFPEVQWIIVPLLFTIIFLVPLFYIKLAGSIIDQVYQPKMKKNKPNKSLEMDVENCGLVPRSPFSTPLNSSLAGETSVKAFCYLRLLIGFPLLLLLSGCMGPDIAVVDISTGTVRHPKFTSRRQIIVSVDNSNQLFRTLLRSDDHLILRTLNPECAEMEVVPVPLYAEGYCSRQGRAFSPTGDRMVYFRAGTHVLCLYDLKTCRESEIWPDIAKFEMDIPKVEWLSDSELLIVRSADDRGSSNEIVVLDVASGTRHRLATPVSLSSFDYSLSPDRGFLAYWEGREKNSIYGRIKVLDVKAGNVVADISSGNDELIGHPSWSFDGKSLGYVEGNRILVFMFDTRMSRTVSVLDSNTITYNLLVGQNVIVHRGARDQGGGSYEEMPVKILNCHNGKCLKEVDIDVNGEMYFLETDRRVVCEIGY